MISSVILSIKLISNKLSFVVFITFVAIGNTPNVFIKDVLYIFPLKLSLLINFSKLIIFLMVYPLLFVNCFFSKQSSSLISFNLFII